MARSVEEASREYEVRQLGYTVQRWPEMDHSPEAAAEDVLDAVERSEALSDSLDWSDMDDAAIDPSALEPRRVRSAGNEPRAPYHSDPLEERRQKWPSNSAHIADGRAVYLREGWDERFEKQFQMAGNWRVQAAGKAILAGQESLDQFHRDFSNRRPNPLMVQDVRDNVPLGQEPAWYSQMSQGYTPAFREQGFEYGVVVDGELVSGPYPDRAEAVENMVDGGVIEQEAFDLAYPELIAQPIDEAEPYPDAAMGYVRADPALMAVVLGEEGPLTRDPDSDPSNICPKVCERLVEDHRALCLDHPARALAVETGWKQTRDRLRDQIPEASDPPLAKALLDQADDLARTQTAVYDRLRYQAAVGFAAGRTGSHAGAFSKEVTERLADECYPDIHAGVAVVDPASPLAVRPAGAGGAYDAAALSCVVESAVAACQWDWEARGAGRWVKDQVVFTSLDDVVVELLDLEQTHVDQGRLAGYDSGPAVEGELPTGAEGRASAQISSVLAALEERGVRVRAEPIDAPRAVLDRGSTVLSVPSDWVVAAPDLEPLETVDVPSLTDKLGSGAAALQVPGVDDTRELYRQVGVASLRAYGEVESNFSDREVLYKVHRLAGKYSVELATRQLEHFAERMTNKTWGLTSDASGSPAKWEAPGSLASQTQSVDRLVDRAAAVDARLVTSSAAQSADRTFNERRVAERAVDRLAGQIDRLSAAGMDIRLTEAKAPSYQPDSRLVKDQRDPEKGPARDSVVIPTAALDRRQPLCRLVDAHVQVHAVVARAVGHPARADRQSAVTLARVQDGAAVRPERQAQAVKREAAHVNAYVAQQITKSWRQHGVERLPAGPVPDLDKKDLAVLRRSERWVKQADVAPAGSVAPKLTVPQPLRTPERVVSRTRTQQPAQPTHAVVRPEVSAPAVPAGGRRRIAPIQGPISTPGR